MDQDDIMSTDWLAIKSNIVRNVTEDLVDFKEITIETISVNELIDLGVKSDFFATLPQPLIEDFHEIFVATLKGDFFLLHEADQQFFEKYTQYLDHCPLGTWSGDIVDFLLQQKELPDKNLAIRVQCEKYFNEENLDEKLIRLQEIEKYIIEKQYGMDDKVNRIGTLSYSQINKTFLRHVYLSNEQSLINIFSKHLPIPKRDFFEPNHVPTYVLEREANTNQIILQFIRKNENVNFSELESKVKKIQRFFRQRARLNQELIRIPKRHEEQFITIDARKYRQTIKAKQSVYIPQKCNQELADRIIELAGNISLLKYVVHETKSPYLKSILDDGLFGRNNLYSMLMNFSPAALNNGDVANGDGNAICFGANYGKIDPLANGNIQFHYDFKKVIGSIHCAFFKQQDFGFFINQKQIVGLDDLTLILRHTWMPNAYKQGHKCMEINLDYVANIPNYELLSYDVENIDMILILNFFRFLDNLTTTNGGDASEMIDLIYKKIESLNDKKLIGFLESIGKSISNTMEFNFYGAHQVEFDALISIKSKETTYQLVISHFIAELERGEFQTLKESMEIFPTLFESYRFLDYLINRISNTSALEKLMNLRAGYDTPCWYPNDALVHAQNLIAQKKSDERSTVLRKRNTFDSKATPFCKKQRKS